MLNLEGYPLSNWQYEFRLFTKVLKDISFLKLAPLTQGVCRSSHQYRVDYEFACPCNTDTLSPL
jgi:hypothetical protein